MAPGELSVWAAPVALALLAALIGGMAYIDRRAVRRQHAAEIEQQRMIERLRDVA
jgi:cytochrome c-type biogenesis protein CcmH/NrfF